jgi:hypothetical protein
MAVHLHVDLQQTRKQITPRGLSGCAVVISCITPERARRAWHTACHAQHSRHITQDTHAPQRNMHDMRHTSQAARRVLCSAHHAM